MKDKGEYWVCVIGPINREDFPEVNGFDSPMRKAVEDKLQQYALSASNCWSGWGCNEKTKDKILKAWS